MNTTRGNLYGNAIINCFRLFLLKAICAYCVITIQLLIFFLGVWLFVKKALNAFIRMNTIRGNLYGNAVISCFGFLLKEIYPCYVITIQLVIGFFLNFFFFFWGGGGGVGVTLNVSELAECKDSTFSESEYTLSLHYIAFLTIYCWPFHRECFTFYVCFNMLLHVWVSNMLDDVSLELIFMWSFFFF